MSVYVLHIKSRVGQKVTSLKRLGEIFFFSCITAVVVFDQGTKAPESVCSNSSFSKHDSLWMPAKAFITSFYSYKGRG